MKTLSFSLSSCTSCCSICCHFNRTLKIYKSNMMTWWAFMFMCKCMFGRHMNISFGEAAWTVKCGFSVTEAPDAVCIISYLCDFFFFLSHRFCTCTGTNMIFFSENQSKWWVGTHWCHILELLCVLRTMSLLNRTYILNKPARIKRGKK